MAAEEPGRAVAASTRASGWPARALSIVLRTERDSIETRGRWPRKKRRMDRLRPGGGSAATSHAGRETTYGTWRTCRGRVVDTTCGLPRGEAAAAPQCTAATRRTTSSHPQAAGPVPEKLRLSPPDSGRPAAARRQNGPRRSSRRRRRRGGRARRRSGLRAASRPRGRPRWQRERRAPCAAQR